MQLPPGNWFPPPDGNRSRLFPNNEKHSFPGFPCGQQGGTGVPLPGILIVEVYSSERAGYFEAMIVCVFNWKSKWFSARFTLG
jgi:hypothetical protein